MTLLPVLIAAVALAGCATPGAQREPATTTPGGHVDRPDWEPIESGTRAARREPARLVVDDREEWVSEWRGLHERDASAIAPDVDFATQRAVIVLLGDASDCREVRVTEARWDARDVALTVNVSWPPAGSFCAASVTQPWTAVRLNAVPDAVRFVDG